MNQRNQYRQVEEPQINNRQVVILNTDLNNIDRWRKFAAPEIQSWGFDCIVVNQLQKMNNSLDALKDVYSSFNLLVRSNKIKDDAIFIVTDANSSVSFELLNFKLKNNKQYLFVGFWHNIPDASYVSLFKSVFSIYDINLVVDADTYRKFKKIKIPARFKLLKCDLPFSNILRRTGTELLYHEGKEIRYLTDSDSKHLNKIIVNIGFLYKDYSFNKFNFDGLNLKEYYSKLYKIKYLLIFNQSNLDMLHIWESMICGVIPLVPNTEYYSKFIPAEFTYNKRILRPPFSTFVKNRNTFFDRLNGMEANFIDYKEKLPAIAQKIHDEYYDSNNFKQILLSIE